MAYQASDGKKFSMGSRLRAHEHDLKLKGAKPDALQPPAPEHDDASGPGSVHEHLMAMHDEMGGAHTHIHHKPEGGHTTHHVTEDGEVQGPHEHATAEELVEHLRNHLPEEEQEIAEGDGEDENEEAE